MLKLLRYPAQILAYVVVAVLLGYFSAAPPYEHFSSEAAQIKISFAHGGKPKGECRELSAEEQRQLPPNMRRKQRCPRERVAIRFELEVDGTVLVAETLEPTGVAKDLPSRIYTKFPVEAGRHHIVARLRDSNQPDGFDYERAAEIVLAPEEILVIDFRTDQGGFLFL